ncbi:MAG: 30S ribosomal protein S9 [Candidatus Eisenbacteria bacterium]|nr:30S ribosomal protein S9 [Candidatus Eisenbacteria bacterium]
MADILTQSTGRRKESVARVRLRAGNGKATINGLEIDSYFGRETLVMLARQPLTVTDTVARYDVDATVFGGGKAGQAGAVMLGIARALVTLDPTLLALLRKNSLLTRDSRMKERKKYGQPGARKRFQFSKR